MQKQEKRWIELSEVVNSNGDRKLKIGSLKIKK
jgi:hypothetical protein